MNVIGQRRRIAASVAAALFGVTGPALAAGGGPAGALAWVPAVAAADQRGRQGREPEGEPIRETRTIALGPAGFLELKTASGSITVVAGGGRDVQVEIIRRARGRSPEEMQRSLDGVRVAVEHEGDRASVTAIYEGDRRSGPRADVSYNVTAPAGTRINASSASGNVTIRGIRGDVTTSLASGSIVIEDAEQLSSAKALSGTVTLRRVSSRSGLVVATVSGRIDAEGLKADSIEVDAVSGAISLRNVSTNRATVRALSGAIDFSGDLAKGGRYEFQAHSGNVHLAAGGAGFMLQATSFSGTIRPDPGLALKAVSSNPRSLRATVGDGSATVSATTFSGNVTIGRR
jgi:DUF4097 and DUF4098 domain-containing protein YvlB